MLPFHRPYAVQVSQITGSSLKCTMSKYSYALLSQDLFECTKSPFVNWAVHITMAQRIGERMGLELKADFDNIKRRDSESDNGN